MVAAPAANAAHANPSSGRRYCLSSTSHGATAWKIANNNAFCNPRRKESWGHGAQKPVECMRRPIVNNSRPGQAIYDPFLGSGTSLARSQRP
jgi:hypothetical protein